MGILLVQSAVSLVFPASPENTLQHDIDVIVRTAAASIFGYFLSGPLQKNSEAEQLLSAPAPAALAPENTSAATVKNKIGFAVGDVSQESGGIQLTQQKRAAASHKPHIAAATCIGLFCLVSLILLRNSGWTPGTDTTAAAATVAQFRDFISGCIGFLIGCARTSTQTADPTL